MAVSPSGVIMRHSDVFQVCLRHSGVQRSRTSQVRSYQHFLLRYFHTVYILFPTFSNPPFFPLRSANPWCLWLRLFICTLVLHHCLRSYEIVSFVFCTHACLPLSFQFKVAHILTSSSKTPHMWHHWLQISANATASNLMGDYKQFVSWNQSNTFKSLFHCGSSRVIADDRTVCLFSDGPWCVGSHQSVNDRGYKLKVLLQRKPFVRQGQTWKEARSSCRWTVWVGQSSGGRLLTDQTPLLTLALEREFVCVRSADHGWPPCQKWNTSIKTDKDKDEQRRR